MSTAQTSWTLKIEFGCDVRRIREWPDNVAEPSIEHLRAAVCSLFELNGEQVDRLLLTYRDDDGDSCTLVATTLMDALDFASKRGVLRITASCPHREVDMESLHSWESAESDQNRPAADVLNAERRQGSTPPMLEDVQGIQETVTRRLSELHQTTSDHLQSARPQIADGVLRFKQQVASDFQMTSADMKEALHRCEGESSCRHNFREAIGTVAGLVAAARLVPVRATVLAATSVSAVLRPGAVTDSSNETVTEEGSSTATPSDAAFQQLHASQFSHFKHQVSNDFLAAQSEICEAFRHVLGNKQDQPQSDPRLFGNDAEQDAGRNSQAITVPVVVSTLVGGSVAACLLPVRATRLAVAQLSGAAAPIADLHEHSEEQ